MLKNGGRNRLTRDAILSITRQLNGGDVNEDMADYLAFPLEQLYGHILRLTASHPNLREMEALICEAARSLRAFEGLCCNDGYELPVDYSESVGRPRFGVSRAQLKSLLQNGFSGTQIAQMLAISLSTVRIQPISE